jgi:predicted Ser/Thr protein kinase
VSQPSTHPAEPLPTADPARAQAVLGELGLSADDGWTVRIVDEDSDGHPELTLCPPHSAAGGTAVTGVSLRTAVGSLGTWAEASGAGPVGAGFRFKPRQELGAGGMGQVMLADQEDLGRQVAVKVIRGQDAGLLASLHHEARIAAGLDHPSIVTVHEAGRDFLVMQLVRGQTLSELLRMSPSLPTANAVVALRRVCDAIAHAHAQGLVHRDLKPANIMIGQHGEVLVIDWGLAVQLGGTAPHWLPPPLNRDQAIGGTPSYMAPEQARREAAAIGLATDVFQLGAILYRILAGVAPYRGATARRLVELAARGERLPLAKAAIEAPRALVALADEAMADNPAARPTLTVFAAALDRWLENTRLERAIDTARRAAEDGLARGATARDPRAAYAAYAQAEAAAQTLAHLAPADAQATELRDELSSERVRAAIVFGDLGLAEGLLARLPPGTLTSRLRRELQRAWRRRRAPGRRANWLRAGTLGLALAALGGLGATAWVVGAAERRERRQRQAAAEALLHQADDPQLAPGLRLDLLARAHGLDAGHVGVARAFSAGLSSAGHAALDAGAASVADSYAAVLERVDAPAAAQLRKELAGLAAQPAHGRALETARRRSHLATLRARARATDRNWNWLERAAETVVAWDGDELRGELLELLRSPEPNLRALGAVILGRLPHLRSGPELLPLLDDPVALVAERAWTALARLGDATVLARLERRLAGLTDPVQRLPRELLLPASADTAEGAMALRRAWAGLDDRGPLSLAIPDDGWRDVWRGLRRAAGGDDPGAGQASADPAAACVAAALEGQRGALDALLQQPLPTPLAGLARVALLRAGRREAAARLALRHAGHAAAQVVLGRLLDQPTREQRRRLAMLWLREVPGDPEAVLEVADGAAEGSGPRLLLGVLNRPANPERAASDWPAQLRAAGDDSAAVTTLAHALALHLAAAPDDRVALAAVLPLVDAALAGGGWDGALALLQQLDGADAQRTALRRRVLDRLLLAVSPLGDLGWPGLEGEELADARAALAVAHSASAARLALLTPTTPRRREALLAAAIGRPALPLPTRDPGPAARAELVVWWEQHITTTPPAGVEAAAWRARAEAEGWRRYLELAWPAATAAGATP